VLKVTGVSDITGDKHRIRSGLDVYICVLLIAITPEYGGGCGLHGGEDQQSAQRASGSRVDLDTSLKQKNVVSTFVRFHLGEQYCPSGQIA